MSIAVQRSIASTSEYYDVGVEKYKEALKRLGKAKRELGNKYEVLPAFIKA